MRWFSLHFLIVKGIHLLRFDPTFHNCLIGIYSVIIILGILGNIAVIAAFLVHKVKLEAIIPFSKILFEGNADTSQYFHRQLGPLWPLPLHLHNAADPDGPPQQVLDMGEQHGDFLNYIEYIQDPFIRRFYASWVGQLSQLVFSSPPSQSSWSLSTATSSLFAPPALRYP